MPFQCVAACIETSAEHWFSTGGLIEAVLASCAVPGLLPAVRIDGRHYLDGGIVDSIPVRRALELDADEVYVLQVGRIEQPLEPPRRPHEVAMVAFEIARRRSFASAMADLPRGVRVHVLPTGGSGPRFNDLRQLRYRDFSDIDARIDAADAATEAYLAGVGTGRERARPPTGPPDAAGARRGPAHRAVAGQHPVDPARPGLRRAVHQGSVARCSGSTGSCWCTWFGSRSGSSP